MIIVYDILRANDERGGVSARMISWIEKLPKETIALVERNARQTEKDVTDKEVHRFETDIMKVCFWSG